MSNRFTKYTADKLRLDGWLDKEQADHLRTQLKSVEAERDEFHRCLIAREQALKNECERWVNAMTERDDARARLQEAEWLVQNLVATDTVAATRRDAFLNPKPQDVK